MEVYRFVATTTIDSSTYALVASQIDDAVSIINITTPSAPDTASVVIDNKNGFTRLQSPISITTTTIGSSTYALVVSNPENGVQIIDITEPYQSTNAFAVTDGSNGFTKLNDPRSITTIAGLPEYALVASSLIMAAFKS